MSTRDPKIIVIGAGVAGITMGVVLRRHGYENFRIIEKAEDVGGVWQWNRYPGIACDVPSVIYQFSFNTNPEWSHVFAPGAEIQRYMRDTVTEFDLDRHLTLGTEVTSARFVDDGWDVTMSDGTTDRCDFLVAATGVLHHPNEPEFPGREDFRGDVVHSARWDPSIETAGKRIAVVGNGSTGVQLIGALCEEAENVTLYSRSPQWVINAPTGIRQPGIFKFLLRRGPIASLTYRFGLLWSGVLADLTLKPTWRRRAVQNLARRQLRSIPDPEVREAIEPDYQPLCKRQVISGSYHKTVQRDDVTVLRQGVERFTEKGLVAEDGVEREHDLVIFATGFKAHNYMRPMEMTGRDGVTIEQTWSGGPRAYRMSAIPGFPNLFTILGPNSPIGSISLQYTSELTAGWICHWLDKWSAGEVDTVEVTEEATAEFNEAVREAMPDTVWATGCNSWYLTEDGSVDLWPFDRRTMRRLLTTPEEQHFHLTGGRVPAGAASSSGRTR